MYSDSGDRRPQKGDQPLAPRRVPGAGTPEATGMTNLQCLGIWDSLWLPKRLSSHPPTLHPLPAPWRERADFTRREKGTSGLPPLPKPCCPCPRADSGNELSTWARRREEAREGGGAPSSQRRLQLQLVKEPLAVGARGFCLQLLVFRNLEMNQDKNKHQIKLISNNTPPPKKKQSGNEQLYPIARGERDQEGAKNTIA